MPYKTSFFAVFIFSPLLTAQALVPVTLEDAYRAALKQEQVEVAQATLDSSLAQKDQVIGAALPQVALAGEYGRQDQPANASSSFVRDPRSLSLEVRQSIFSGLKEFDGIDSANARIGSSRAGIERVKSELFDSVAKAFLDVSFYQEELKNRQEIEKLTSDRVGFLKKRVQIGRSRTSELVSSEAQLADASANVADAKLQLVRSRENFALLTGLDSESELAELKTPELKPLEHYQAGIEQAPILNEAKFKLEESDLGVKLAKADHWPSVDLRGNYYLDRNGSSRDVDWAVTVNVTMPIFESGKTEASVRQAAFARAKQDAQNRLLRRGLEASVKTSYASVALGLERQRALKEVVELGRKNYQIQLKDYGLGLASSLEILQVLNQYTQALSSLNRMRVDNLKNYYEIYALLGTASEVQ
jgi:adhesin transport system outer membrane protein